MRKLTLVAVLLLTTTAHAQFKIQDSHTTASLRGIHSIGNGIAWASGTEGTVLRTTDEGATWQRCTTPPDAEKLDFRGIQAFDENTAIIMSSGPGDQSRLYKTTDGCQTWKLLFTNPDKDGFWDALRMDDVNHGWLLGDPVKNEFVIEETSEEATRFPGFQVSLGYEAFDWSRNPRKRSRRLRRQQLGIGIPPARRPTQKSLPLLRRVVWYEWTRRPAHLSPPI